MFYNDFKGKMGGRFEARNFFGFLVVSSFLHNYTSAFLMSSISIVDVFRLGASSDFSYFFY